MRRLLRPYAFHVRQPSICASVGASLRGQQRAELTGAARPALASPQPLQTPPLDVVFEDVPPEQPTPALPGGSTGAASPPQDQPPSTPTVPESMTVPSPSSPSLGPPALCSDGEKEELYSVRAALFGWSDCQTGLLTYPRPRDRVAHHMELFPPLPKADLFERSGWLTELEQSLAAGERETGCEGPSPLEAAAPPRPGCAAPFADVVGRSKAIRYFLHHFLRRSELWHDAVRELLELAVAHVARERLKALFPSFLSDADTRRQDEERLEEVVQVCAVDLSDHILRPCEDVVFYSPAFRARLRSFTEAAEGPFTHPTASWDAYAVAHRQDAAMLASPQSPPFSFGETTPSLVLADVKRREYTSSVETEAQLVNAIEDKERHFRKLQRHAEQWDTLTEDRQNALLFGLGTETVTPDAASRGIYVVDVPETVVFSDVPDEAAAVTAVTATEGERQDHPPVDRQSQWQREAVEEEVAHSLVYLSDTFHLGIVEPLTPRQRTILRYIRTTPAAADILTAAEEASETGPGIAEDDAAVAAATREKGARKRRGRGSRPRAHQYLLGGLFRHSVTGLVEDVQLSKLWEGFQHERSAVLLDTVMALHGAWSIRVRRQLLVELATQAAFLLVFFARDEVRALTPPQQTYSSLWSLHAELEDALRPMVLEGIEQAMPWAVGLAAAATATAADAGMEEEEEEEAPRGPSCPAFESLSLAAQMSYACFGAVHLPRRTLQQHPLPAMLKDEVSAASQPRLAVQGGEAAAATTTTTTPGASRLAEEGPFSLYAAYAMARWRQRGSSSGAAAADGECSIESLKATFEALPLAKALAVGFPFPLREAEEAEVQGRCLSSSRDDKVKEAVEAVSVEVEDVTEEEAIAEEGEGWEDRGCSVPSLSPDSQRGLVADLVAGAASELAHHASHMVLPAIPSEEEAASLAPDALQSRVEAEVRSFLFPVVEELTRKLVAQVLHRRPATDGSEGGEGEAGARREAPPQRRIGRRGRPPLTAEERERRRQQREAVAASRKDEAQRREEEEEEEEQAAAERKGDTKPVPASSPAARRGRPSHAERAARQRLPASPSVDGGGDSDPYTDDVAQILAEMNAKSHSKRAAKLKPKPKGPKKQANAANSSATPRRGRPRHKQRKAGRTALRRTRDRELDSVAEKLRSVTALLAALSKKRV